MNREKKQELLEEYGVAYYFNPLFLNVIKVKRKRFSRKLIVNGCNKRIPISRNFATGIENKTGNPKVELKNFHFFWK